MKNRRTLTDNEFDGVFQEKLYLFEAEPSDAVWTGITEQLDATQKAERSFPILRLAAACLFAMIGFGMWLAATKEPMKLSGVPKQEAVPHSQKAQMSLPVTRVKDKPERMMISKAERKTVRVRPVAERQYHTVSTPDHALKNQPYTDDAKPAEPSAGTVTTLIEQPAPKPTVLAMTEDTPAAPQLSDSGKRTARIRSVGSLVNFVVSKVDKRKDKLIEFEDGDEGTAISSLNLGLLKLKAKNQ